MGKISKSIFDPSSGGIGIRLKIAKAKFTITIEEIIKLEPGGKERLEEKRSKIPNTIAIKRLANIPALATATVPHFLSLKLFGL